MKDIKDIMMPTEMNPISVLNTSTTITKSKKKKRKKKKVQPQPNTRQNCGTISIMKSFQINKAN